MDLSCCVTIHPEVKALDARVAAHGGAARFIQDDGYVIGPAEAVFFAITAFEQELQTPGLQLQRSKSSCFCPIGGLQDNPHRPADIPLGYADDGFGIMVAGVPVGDEQFIHSKLDNKVRKALSKIDTLCTKLRDAHLQSMFCALRVGLAPMMDHWIQHCYPDDVKVAAETFDDGLLSWVSVCFPGLMRQDSISEGRIRLPARRYGAGIRSRADLIPAAFVSTMCRTLPRMLDFRDRHGVLHSGFLPQLAPVLGAGIFRCRL